VGLTLQSSVHDIAKTFLAILVMQLWQSHLSLWTAQRVAQIDSLFPPLQPSQCSRAKRDGDSTTANRFSPRASAAGGPRKENALHTQHRTSAASVTKQFTAMAAY
jgi:hypothetical protein